MKTKIAERNLIMDEQTREALTNRASWLKGAVLLLFYVLLVVVTPILILVSLFGWIGLLVKGQVPSGVRDFGQDLARWYGQTARYLTGNASRRPFPFEDLDCPSDEPGARAESRASSAQGGDRQDRPSPSGKSAVSKSPEGQATGSGKETGDQAGSGSKSASRKSGKKKSGGRKTTGKKKTGKKKTGKKSATRKASGKKASVSKKTPGKGESKTAGDDRGTGDE